MTNNRQCYGVTVLFTCFMYGLHDPVVLLLRYGLKCLGLALGYTDTMMCRGRDTKSSDTVHSGIV